MKRLFFSALAASLLFSSCGNDKQIKSVTTDEDGSKTTVTTNVSDLEKMTETTDEMTRKMEELKKLTPMSTDQLKAALPEEIEGVKRSNFTANSMMGYAMAEGEYKKDYSTELKISIHDCAGETGSAMYGMNYFSKMSFQQESDNGYTKTVDFGGGKAVETYEKNSNECSLTYLANDRLLVMLRGHNMTIAELKTAAGKLNFKVS